MPFIHKSQAAEKTFQSWEQCGTLTLCLLDHVGGWVWGEGRADPAERQLLPLEPLPPSRVAVSVEAPPDLVPVFPPVQDQWPECTHSFLPSLFATDFSLCSGLMAGLND